MRDRLQKSDGCKVRQNLAEHIAKIEARQSQLDDGNTSSIKRVAFGIEEIDQVLDPHHGKGIEYAGLHEIRSATTLSFGAAAGFALVLANHMECERHRGAAHLQQDSVDKAKAGFSTALRPIFWVCDKFCRSEGGKFYGPGLYPFGIDPGRLIRVMPHSFEEAIWAAGEIARSGKTGLGLLEIHGNPHRLDLATTRRLLLRCQKSRTPFFILRQAGEAQTSAVSTRWLVEPALSFDHEHSRFIGKAAWKIYLEKCRGGKTGNWILEWNHHEQAFQIADKSYAKFSRYPKLHAGTPPGKERSTYFKHASRIQSRAPISGNLIASSGNGPHHSQKAGDGVAAV